MGDLAAPVGTVHRHDHQTEAQRGDVGDDEVDRRRRAHHDPVTGAEAGTGEATGDRTRLRLELTVGRPPARVVDGGCIGRGPPAGRPRRRETPRGQEVDGVGRDAWREVARPRRLHPAEATGSADGAS